MSAMVVTVPTFVLVLVLPVLVAVMALYGYGVVRCNRWIVGKMELSYKRRIAEIERSKAPK